MKVSTLTNIEEERAQRLFIDVWDGDPINSMRSAGFSGTDKELLAKAKKMLAQPNITQGIQSRTEFEQTAPQKVADRKERMLWWSDLMRNKDPHANVEHDANGVPKVNPEHSNIPLSLRIKASENLSKAEGDFIQTVDMNQNISIVDVIAQSYSDDDEDEDIDAIEAQYNLLRETSVTNEESLAKLEETHEPIDEDDHPDSISLNDFI